MAVQKKVSIELARIYAEFLELIYLSREMADVCGGRKTQGVFYYLNQRSEKLKQRALLLGLPHELGNEILSASWWKENGFPSYENITL